MKYDEIKRKLSEPVPLDLISQKTQITRSGSEFTIDYVNITDYKDLLDGRAGSNWESEVTDFKQVGDLLCCVVRIKIYADDGVFSHDGTGQEPVTTTAWGDPFSNAYAQAFRRACEGHGLSRELWRKDDHHPRTVNVEPQLNQLRRNNQPQTRQAANGKKQFDNSKPQYGKAQSNADAMTAAQNTLLTRRATENGVDVLAFARAEFEDVQYIDDLSKRAASYLIDELGKPAEAF